MKSYCHRLKFSFMSFIKVADYFVMQTRDNVLSSFRIFMRQTSIFVNCTCCEQSSKLSIKEFVYKKKTFV